jgi:hypothetical protein
MLYTIIYNRKEYSIVAETELEALSNLAQDKDFQCAFGMDGERRPQDSASVGQFIVLIMTLRNQKMLEIVAKY